MQKSNGQIGAVEAPSSLSVFISYSRKDVDFADQLFAALETYNFKPSIDRHGISGAENWEERLRALILEADTMIVVLTPESAASDVIAWEVSEAERLSKRIVPVVPMPLGDVPVPERLAQLNYVFFYAEPSVPGSGFGLGLQKLIATLNTDLDWLREHTRLLQRATEWDTGGRAVGRLLFGSDIAAAKAWAAQRPSKAPEPTALHLEFIRASEEEEAARASAQRKQLETVAAAQAEREKALNREEEALKLAADVQRKRLRLRTIALVAVSAVALLAAWQWQQARAQRAQAVEILNSAGSLIVSLAGRYKFDREEHTKALSVFVRGAGLGDPRAMTNAGVYYENGWGVPQDHAKAREWYEKAAAKGNADAITYIGVLYENGWGVSRDYTKAREHYERAAAKGNERAENKLGVFYVKGWSVKQDYAKGRVLFEKAAAKGDADAMRNLGVLFATGRGVPRDFKKAREWYEKASAKGSETAKANLEALPAIEAAAAGRYDVALKEQELVTAKIIETETKRDGKPGKGTSTALLAQSWYALLAQDYAKALAATERGHALFPDYLPIEVNRAHALMFLERGEEAKALHRAHKGESAVPLKDKPWEREIAKDFAKFREVGQTHPLMDEIEKELGTTP